MQLKISTSSFPCMVQTRLGYVQIVIASGNFILPEYEIRSFTAFAVPIDSRNRRVPIQIVSLKRSYEEVMDRLQKGFELPFDISPHDELMAAVIDALLEDSTVREADSDTK